MMAFPTASIAAVRSAACRQHIDASDQLNTYQPCQKIASCFHERKFLHADNAIRLERHNGR